VNDRYVVPAVVLIASLKGRVPTGLELIVQDTGLGRKARSLLERQATAISCALTFVETSVERFEKAKLLLHWVSPAAFARLTLPSRVAERHRFILDLDCDLLVRADLRPLLSSLPGNGCVLSAVPGYFTNSIWQQEVGSIDDLDVRASDNFFLGGVTIIDAARWEEAEVSERALALFEANPERWNGDLSILNAAVGREWTPLEFRWNVWTLATAGPVRFVRVAGATERAVARSDRVAIAHFPGHFKPWLPAYPLNRWRVEYARVARGSVLPSRLQPRSSIRAEVSRLARRPGAGRQRPDHSPPA
jgi:lipopolysaccharide biosynthesis glycosyltransferase